MDNEIELFVNKRLSQNTRESYERVLKKLRNWSEDNKVDIFKGRKWTGEYMLELQRKGLSNKTINHTFVVITQFYKQVTGEKLYMDRLKEKPSVVEFLLPEEVEKLLGNLEVDFKPVVHLMLDTGMRVGEVSKLSRERFTEIPDNFTIIGKGLKERRVYISEFTKKILEATFSNGKIFGKEWGEKTIQRRMSLAGKRAGITKHLHPHMLRHTMATQMLWNGVGITEIQKMLGHSYLQTTQIYTHVTSDRLRDVWQKYLERKILPVAG